MSSLSRPLLDDAEAPRPKDEEHKAVEPDATKEEEDHLSWVELGLLLFGFSSPSGCVGVAYSMGAVGVVLGPFLCIVVTAATCCGALMLNAMVVALNPEPADGLEALGAQIYGPRTGLWGRVIQQGNFVLYLPVALLICAEAAQGFMPETYLRERCVDYYVVGTSLVCFALTQVRTLTGRAASMLSRASLVCVAIVVALLLWIVFTNDPEDYDDAANERPSGFRLAGNPDVELLGEGSASTRRRHRRGWSKLCLGASTTAWAYVPTFLTVEVSRALRDPRRDFEKGLALSASLNCAVFVVVGLSCVVRWGWDVTDPIMATDIWPSSEPRSKALYFFWFVATAISYAFSSMALTAACARRWLPDLRWDTSRTTDAAQPDDDTPTTTTTKLSSEEEQAQNKNAPSASAVRAAWFVVSVPPFLLALLMAIVVPSLFAMLAVTTAATVPWVNNFYPAVLYWRFTRQRASSSPPPRTLLAVRDDDGDEAKVAPCPDDPPADHHRLETKPVYLVDRVPARLLVGFTLGVGLLVFVACAIGAVAKLADHDLRGPVAIGCPGWRVFEDDLA